VRIRLSNYINKNSDEKIDDSICKSGGKATTVKSITSIVSNDQIVVIITQILQIIVQIVNQMGSLSKPDQNWSSAAQKTTTANWNDIMSEIKKLMQPTTAKPKSKTSTKYPIKTSTLNWDNLISEIMGQPSSSKKTKKPDKTTTISWEDLISEMMNQMSSTSMSSGSASTSAPVETTTVDWDDLISEVVGEMDNQFGTKSTSQTKTSSPTASTPTASTADLDELISAMFWDQNQNKTTQTTRKSDSLSNENWDQLFGEIMDQNQYTRTSPSRSPIKTTPSVESTTYDIQACIDSIISIIGGVESQMPGMSITELTTATTKSQPQQTTQDLDAMISGILEQFG
jgi:chemotaxis protein CheY-P-specific phosphatase CheC